MAVFSESRDIDSYLALEIHRASLDQSEARLLSL